MADYQASQGSKTFNKEATLIGIRESSAAPPLEKQIEELQEAILNATKVLADDSDDNPPQSPPERPGFEAADMGEQSGIPGRQRRVQPFPIMSSSHPTCKGGLPIRQNDRVSPGRLRRIRPFPSTLSLPTSKGLIANCLRHIGLPSSLEHPSGSVTYNRGRSPPQAASMAILPGSPSLFPSQRSSSQKALRLASPVQVSEPTRCRRFTSTLAFKSSQSQRFLTAAHSFRQHHVCSNRLKT